jgi:hypothetical protein
MLRSVIASGVSEYSTRGGTSGYIARHQPISLQAPERRRQHALADSLDATPQLAESQRSRLAQNVNDVDRPLVPDACENLMGAAADRFLRAVRPPRSGGLACGAHGSLQVTKARSSAFLAVRERADTLMVTKENFNADSAQSHRQGSIGASVRCSHSLFLS